MRSLFTLFTFLIAYGSLYPFNFVSVELGSESLAQLFNFDIRSSGRIDFISNVLLFVPFGLLGMQAMQSLRVGLRVSVVLILGFNLALGLQVLQLWVPGRVAFGADALINMIGCALGCALAFIPATKALSRFTAHASRPPIPLLLALAWITYQWAPFVPSMDIGLLKNQLKGLIFDPSVSLVWTFQGVVTWLVIFHFLKQSSLTRIQERHYLPLALVVTISGLFIVGNTFKADRVLGVALALICWLVIRKVQRPGLLAVLLALLIGAIKFSSLDLRDEPGSMSWVPFSGAMGGNMLINVLATYKKLILYGSLIWLLVEAGFRLRNAALVTSAYLLITEYGQIFFTRTSPEVTDAILALGLGLAFHLYGLSSPDDLKESQLIPSEPHTRARSRRSYPRVKKKFVVLGAVAVATMTIALTLLEQPPRLSAPSWAGNNASIIFDPHTHTQFSDGRLTPQELVALGAENGCDAIAITDHSDGKGASPQQLAELRGLRHAYPELLLLAGIELNIPSYGEREHLNLLVTPELENDFLRSLGDLAQESIEQRNRRGARDRSFSTALSAIPNRNSQSFTIYNHPSRKVARASESVKDVQRWSTSGFNVAALSGAPGHQLSDAIGSYRGALSTIDRWDPIVATIGGGWDELLSRGHQIWGALAVSDYHNSRMDAPPCGFARTHVSTPSADYAGLMQGLNQGTFWAGHGLILSSLTLSLQVDGLSDSAYPGSIISLGDADSLGIYQISVERDSGSRGLPLIAEVISNCQTGKPELLQQTVLSPGINSASGALPLFEKGLDGASCYVRARVRLSLDDEPDLMAYTNPIRIIL